MKIGVYGSLRKDCYNYTVMEDDNVKYLGDDIIKGFALYSLGSYPAIIPDDSTSVVVEVYDVPEDTYSIITSMELGAGYEIQKVETKYGIVDVYVFKNEYGYINESRPKIKHGDWVRYLRDREKQIEEDKNRFLKEQYEKLKRKK